MSRMLLQIAIGLYKGSLGQLPLRQCHRNMPAQRHGCPACPSQSKYRTVGNTCKYYSLCVSLASFYRLIQIIFYSINIVSKCPRHRPALFNNENTSAYPKLLQGGGGGGIFLKYWRFLMVYNNSMSTCICMCVCLCVCFYMCRCFSASVFVCVARKHQMS
jgi:hypothetical protein